MGTLAPMAKQTAIATRPQVVVMQAPRRRAVSRIGGRHLSVVRRAPSRRSVSHAAPTTPIAIGGLIVGYAQGKGLLDKLPVIGGSKTVTLGIAGYLVAKHVSNRTLKYAGVAALAIAAADFGRVQGGGTSGDDDVGDDDVGDDDV